jgi:hypothetical protein
MPRLLHQASRANPMGRETCYQPPRPQVNATKLPSSITSLPCAKPTSADVRSDQVSIAGDKVSIPVKFALRFKH